MTLDEFISRITDLLDKGEFESIYRMATVPFEYMYKLTEALYELGEQPHELIKNWDMHISEMLDILKLPGKPYNGAQLMWLVDGYGNDYYLPLYLYYFEHNPKFKVERIDPEYSLWGEGRDWYVCEKSSWDIDKFKLYIEDLMI